LISPAVGFAQKIGEFEASDASDGMHIAAEVVEAPAIALASLTTRDRYRARTFVLIVQRLKHAAAGDYFCNCNSCARQRGHHGGVAE